MDKSKQIRNYFRKALTSKDKKKSIDLLTQVIDLDNKHLSAYVLRATRLMESRKFQDAHADLNKAFEIRPKAIRINFVKASNFFYQKEYSQVIKQVLTIEKKTLSNKELVKPNPSMVQRFLPNYDCFTLTIDELALCYLMRAEAIDLACKDHSSSLHDVKKAENLETTKPLKDKTANLKYRIQRKISLEKEIKRKSTLSFRIKNSFSSRLALCFWAISLFCTVYAISSFFYGETMTAYKLFGLGFLTFPPMIVLVGWGISRTRSSWNLFKVENATYAFFLFMFLMFSSFYNASSIKNSVSSPGKPELSIQVGSDSGEAIQRMKDFAKYHGGYVECPSRFYRAQIISSVCIYYEEPGHRRVVVDIKYDYVEPLPYIRRKPAKGTVTRVSGK